MTRTASFPFDNNSKRPDCFKKEHEVRLVEVPAGESLEETLAREDEGIPVFETLEQAEAYWEHLQTLQDSK